MGSEFAIVHVGFGLFACGCPHRIARKPEPGELPALFWREEVAIAQTRMSARRDTGATTQDHLVDHELAVIFADSTLGFAKTGVGRVGAGGPLPERVVYLQQAFVVRR